MDFLKAGVMKNREDAGRIPSEETCHCSSEESSLQVQLPEKPQGEEDLQTPLTSDLPLEETAPEFSIGCHFQSEASLLSSPVLPACRSAC